MDIPEKTQADIFTSHPRGTEWLLIIGMSVIPLLVGQIAKYVNKRRTQGDSTQT
jgi:hypothetical protein